MRSALAASSLLLALAVSTSLVGCKGNSLDGKWNISGSEGVLPGSTAVYEFAGGQATMTLNLKTPQAGEAVISIAGPYTLSGDKLTLNAKDIKIDDSKLTPMAKTMMASPQVKEGMKKSLGENKEFTVKFDSSDQVLLTGKQGTITLTRVK